MAVGGNENESCKEEIYYTCMSQRGVHQMPLKAQGKHKVLVRLQKIGGKETLGQSLRPKISMRGKAGPSHQLKMG